MDSKKGLNILSNTSDLINAGSIIIKDEHICELLSTFGDLIPPAKLLIQGYYTISDKLFFTKIDKFMRFANLNKENISSKEEKNLEKFKLKIKQDSNFRERVSQYVLFKIDKFDEDYKLKIFANACIDFFNSKINEKTLINVSEVIDSLNSSDIEIVKCLYLYNSNLIQIKVIADDLADRIDKFRIYSCISKLIMNGLVIDEINTTWGSIYDKYLKQISLSPFGKNLYKYL